MEFEKGFKGQFGLGLAIVKQIAAAHDARVWAANEDGGPAFYIEWNSHSNAKA
jgi:two-component system sensor histidine kinase CssS